MRRPSCAPMGVRIARQPTSYAHAYTQAHNHDGACGTVHQALSVSSSFGVSTTFCVCVFTCLSHDDVDDHPWARAMHSSGPKTLQGQRQQGTKPAPRFLPGTHQLLPRIDPQPLFRLRRDTLQGSRFARCMGVGLRMATLDRDLVRKQSGASYKSFAPRRPRSDRHFRPRSCVKLRCGASSSIRPSWPSWPSLP